MLELDAILTQVIAQAAGRCVGCLSDIEVFQTLIMELAMIDA